MSESSERSLRVLVGIAESLGYLTPLDSATPLTPDQQDITVEIDFTGPFSGKVVMALTADAARHLAANMLGMEVDAGSHEDAIEAGRELANVVAANVLTALHGSDSDFRIGIPRTVAARPLAGQPSIGLELAEGSIAMAVEEAGEAR